MVKDLISVISPVYGDKRNVRLLYDKLTSVLTKMDVDYEIILVNDCCPYGSGEEIEKLALADTHVKFIDLSRNFGQHYAIKAGIDYAKGDYAVVMDCDLQDNPEDIPKFYEKIKEGYDIVFGVRKTRQDSKFKKFLSFCFGFVQKHLSDFHSDYNHGNFSIISKKVIDSFKIINNYNFNYCTQLYFLGYNPQYIDIEKEQRAEGESGYNIIKGMKLALKSLISNSNKPLIFAAYCSFIMFVLSFCFIIKLVFDYFIFHNRLLGWTSIMASLFLIGGLLFVYLSILGLYIGGIFQEVKNRPLYIVKKTINIERDNNE